MVNRGVGLISERTICRALTVLVLAILWISAGPPDVAAQHECDPAAKVQSGWHERE